MMDLRPAGYIIGLTTATLGAMMLFPMALDWASGNANWTAFLESALITFCAGGLVAMASQNALGRGLTLQDIFLLTTGVWVVLPVAAALPFMLGEPGVDMTDALFESMSGMTTTGSTVFVGLDDLPPGVNLWRGITQWIGGLGIIVIALIFLPVMKVGGMQFFKSEAFDTLGKVLPRSVDISVMLVQIYLGITLACVFVYWALGMSGLDAVVHGLTTIATGGFSTSDASFSKYSGVLEYVATLFMFLSTLPFIRFIQLVQGTARPLLVDSQIRTYFLWTCYAIGAVVLWRLLVLGDALEPALRESAFNVVSIFTGTGYGSADVTLWGPLPFVILIIVGFIGGCTSSTGCSVKVFRYQVMFKAIGTQLRRLSSPSAVEHVRLDGRSVGEDVITSVIAFFVLFVLTFGVLAVGLSMTGLAPKTAITASWTAIANIGPAYGPEVGPTGAMDGFPTMAKWLMILGMLLGRLELMSVFVLFTWHFWRR
jgi:trk system potassium uptake protein TrkH